VTSSVVVFGREPLPGRVKTRLAAAIGSAAAARVYAVLLDHTLEAASASRLPVLLSLAECPSASWAAELSVPFEIQKAGGLGERMADAFARRFTAGDENVVVIGSDCAALTSDLIRQAAVLLDENSAVLGPAVDGGYYLIGQRSPGADLFTGIPFSDPQTSAATRERLSAHALCWSELTQLPDIDTAEDLEALLADPVAPRPFIRRLAAAVHETR
jgi:rSAM/selenodomain-associated transferase 1